MAPHDEEDDPAVYRSGSTKNKGKESQNVTTPKKPPSASTSKPIKPSAGSQLSDSTSLMDNRQNGINEEPAGPPSDSDTETEGEVAMQEDEDESTLLTTQPGFNKLLLVLRDERVMRFVKYVSGAAPGSRWDICAEYEVGMVEEGSNGSESEAEGGSG